MKKKFFIILGTAVLSFALVLTGCNKEDGESKATATKSPTASASTATPKNEATPSATPTTATPTKDPNAPKNLLDDVLSEDYFQNPAGFEINDDMWSGPALREIVEADVNGTKMDCLSVKLMENAATFGNNMGNVFGASEILKTNTTYKFTVTFKYTDPTEPTDANHRELMYITCNAAKENLPSEAANNLGSGIKFSAKDEWQTIEYVFTTGAALPEDNGTEHGKTAYIMVGPSCDYQRPYGEASVDSELLIASVSLFEVTPS